MLIAFVDGAGARDLQGLRPAEPGDLERQQSSETRKVTKTLNGIELSLFYDVRENPRSSEVRILLRILERDLIVYDDGPQSYGLTFQLTTASGQVISPMPEWERKYPEHLGPVVFSQPQMAGPRTIAFIMPLDEAYGPNWSKGVRFRVSCNGRSDQSRAMSEERLRLTMKLRGPDELQPPEEPQPRDWQRIILSLEIAAGVRLVLALWGLDRWIRRRAVNHA